MEGQCCGAVALRVDGDEPLRGVAREAVDIGIDNVRGLLARGIDADDITQLRATAEQATKRTGPFTPQTSPNSAGSIGSEPGTTARADNLFPRTMMRADVRRPERSAEAEAPLGGRTPKVGPMMTAAIPSASRSAAAGWPTSTGAPTGNWGSRWRSSCSSRTSCAHMVQEAQAAAQVRHTNLVRVFGTGALDSTAYIMELLEGPNLGGGRRCSGWPRGEPS